MKTDMSSHAVAARLDQVAELTSLDPARRLEGKVPMHAEAVLARLKQVSELRNLGLLLVAAGKREHQG